MDPLAAFAEEAAIDKEDEVAFDAVVAAFAGPPAEAKAPVQPPAAPPRAQPPRAPQLDATVQPRDVLPPIDEPPIAPAQPASAEPLLGEALAAPSRAPERTVGQPATPQTVATLPVAALSAGDVSSRKPAAPAPPLPQSKLAAPSPAAEVALASAAPGAPASDAPVASASAAPVAPAAAAAKVAPPSAAKVALPSASPLAPPPAATVASAPSPKDRTSSDDQDTAAPAPVPPRPWRSSPKFGEPMFDTAGRVDPGPDPTVPPLVNHHIPDLPAIAAQPRLPIADEDEAEPVPPPYLPAARFSRRDAAVVALCLVGVVELGWLGWKLGRGTAPATPTAAAPAAAASPASVPEPRAPLSLGDPSSARSAAAGGKPATLAIRTDPADALVLVDGTFRGRSPITLSDLTPGAHTIVLSRLPNFAERVVTLKPGESASLVLTLPATSSTAASAATSAPAPSPAAPAAAAAAPRQTGWLSVKSDVPVQLFERGRRLGDSRSGRLTLGVGRHEIEAINEPLGIRARQTVVISAGRGATIAVAAAPGSVNINALPWASVSIDGAPVGDTPLANLRLAAGQHDVVFTHPELGERRLTITVPSGASTRVSTDLRKK